MFLKTDHDLSAHPDAAIIPPSEIIALILAIALILRVMPRLSGPNGAVSDASRNIHNTLLGWYYPGRKYSPA